MSQYKSELAKLLENAQKMYQKQADNNAKDLSKDFVTPLKNPLEDLDAAIEEVRAENQEWTKNLLAHSDYTSTPSSMAPTITPSSNSRKASLRTKSLKTPTVSTQSTTNRSSSSSVSSDIENYRHKFYQPTLNSTKGKSDIEEKINSKTVTSVKNK